jgi:hypothetical protein
MTENTGNNNAKRGLMLFAKMLMVAALNIGGVFVVARLLPLPKGQGFAYVAHPFFALAFGLLAAVAYFILSWIWQKYERRLLIGALVASGLFSLLIFGTA